MKIFKMQKYKNINDIFRIRKIEFDFMYKKNAIFARVNFDLLLLINTVNSFIIK